MHLAVPKRLRRSGPEATPGATGAVRSVAGTPVSVPDFVRAASSLVTPRRAPKMAARLPELVKNPTEVVAADFLYGLIAENPALAGRVLHDMDQAMESGRR